MIEEIHTLIRMKRIIVRFSICVRDAWIMPPKMSNLSPSLQFERQLHSIDVMQIETRVRVGVFRLKTCSKF